MCAALYLPYICRDQILQLIDCGLDTAASFLLLSRHAPVTWMIFLYDCIYREGGVFLDRNNVGFAATFINYLGQNSTSYRILHGKWMTPLLFQLPSFTKVKTKTQLYFLMETKLSCMFAQVVEHFTHFCTQPDYNFNLHIYPARRHVDMRCFRVATRPLELVLASLYNAINSTRSPGFWEKMCLI